MIKEILSPEEENKNAGAENSEKENRRDFKIVQNGAREGERQEIEKVRGALNLPLSSHTSLEFTPEIKTGSVESGGRAVKLEQGKTILKVPDENWKEENFAPKITAANESKPVQEQAGAVFHHLTKPQKFSARIKKWLQLAGIFGIATGALADKAKAEETNTQAVTGGIAPIYNVIEKANTNAPVYNYEQKTWPKGTPTSDWQKPENAAPQFNQRGNANQPAETVQNQQRASGGGQAYGGTVYEGGASYNGASYNGASYNGTVYEGGGEIFGGVGGVPGGYYDQVEGNSGGPTWAHEVTDPWTAQREAQINNRANQIAKRSGNKVIPTGNPNQPLARNPFNLKNWFRGRR